MQADRERESEPTAVRTHHTAFATIKLAFCDVVVVVGLNIFPWIKIKTLKSNSCR